MGSKQRSSSSSNTKTITNTKNLNVQGVQGTSVFTDGNVTVTDANAIEGSLQIGQDSVAAIAQISNAFIEANKSLNDRAIGLSETVSAGIGEYAGRLTDLAETAATDDTAETIQTMIKYGAGAAVIVAGVYAFKKGK